jgi:hypothetical protein
MSRIEKIKSQLIEEANKRNLGIIKEGTQQANQPILIQKPVSKLEDNERRGKVEYNDSGGISIDGKNYEDYVGSSKKVKEINLPDGLYAALGNCSGEWPLVDNYDYFTGYFLVGSFTCMRCTCVNRVIFQVQNGDVFHKTEYYSDEQNDYVDKEVRPTEILKMEDFDFDDSSVDINVISKEGIKNISDKIINDENTPVGRLLGDKIITNYDGVTYTWDISGLPSFTFTDNEISGPLYSLYNNHINENGDITINKQFGIEDYDENGKFFGVYDKGSGTSYTVYDSKSGPKFHKHSH